MKTKQNFTLDVVTFELEGPEEFLGVLKHAVDKKLAPYKAPKKPRKPRKTKAQNENKATRTTEPTEEPFA